MNLTGMIRMRLDRLNRYGIKPAAIIVASSDMEGLAEEAGAGCGKLVEMFGLKVHSGPITGIVIAVDQ